MKRNINERLDKVFLSEAIGLSKLGGDIDPDLYREMPPEEDESAGDDIDEYGNMIKPKEPTFKPGSRITADQPPAPDTPSVRNVASGDLSTASGEVPGESGLSEPVDIPPEEEQQPPLLPDENPLDVEEQGQPELSSDEAEKSFHTARGQFEAVFGTDKDPSNWDKIGDRIGMNDKKILAAEPRIKEEWDAIGKAVRENIWPMINDIGMRASNVLRGGMKSPEPEQESAPMPEPAPELAPETEEIKPEDLPKIPGEELDLPTGPLPR